MFAKFARSLAFQFRNLSDVSADKISDPAAKLAMSASDVAVQIELEEHAKFLENEKLRRTNLLKIFCFILLVVFSSGPGIYVGLMFLQGYPSSILIAAALFAMVALGCFFLSYRLNRYGFFEPACWILVGGFLITYLYSAWLCGATLPTQMGFVLLISIVVVLMRGPAILAIASFCVLFSAALTLGELVFHFYVPPYPLPQEASAVVTVMLVSFGVPGIAAVQFLPTRFHARSLQAQNQKLYHTLTLLYQRQITSQNVSEQVLSVSTQLRSTATQQASGSQTQLSTIGEVKAAMTQLSSAATYIAQQAKEVNEMALVMTDHSQHTRNTTVLAASQSEQGLFATNQTALISVEVGELYSQLLETTEELKERTTNMSRILNLASDVAARTHLLSINASIEAAGAGVYGERFKMVSQSIRELANNSASFSQQIIELVRQLESSVQRVVEVCKDGYNKTVAMKEAVRKSSQIIGELQQLAVQSQNEAELINHHSQNVSGRTETIRSATYEQRASSEQVQHALDNLIKIAQEVASVSTMVSTTSLYLEEASQNLNLSLTEFSLLN